MTCSTTCPALFQTPSTSPFRDPNAVMKHRDAPARNPRLDQARTLQRPCRVDEFAHYLGQLCIWQLEPSLTLPGHSVPDGWC